MTNTVVFTPEAKAQLVGLYRFIADAASPAVAARYTDAVVSFCEALVTFPRRGVHPSRLACHQLPPAHGDRLCRGGRPDISIIGVFYGGRDFETALQGEAEE